MASGEQLILVHMLTPQPLGSYFDCELWPLHITIVPWFSAQAADHATIRRALNQAALNENAVDVTVGTEITQGAQLVNPIVEQGILQPLHQTLLTVVRELQMPLVSEEWVGDAYQAYIAKQSDERHATTGEIVHVGDITLVHVADDRTCQILATFTLREAQPDE